MPQAGSPEGEKFRTLGKHLMDGDRGNFGTSEGLEVAEPRSWEQEDIGDLPSCSQSSATCV